MGKHYGVSFREKEIGRDENIQTHTDYRQAEVNCSSYDQSRGGNYGFDKIIIYQDRTIMHENESRRERSPSINCFRMNMTSNRENYQVH